MNQSSNCKVRDDSPLLINIRERGQQCLFVFAVHMGKLHTSGTCTIENTNLQGEDINEQILRQVNSAAGVLSYVQSHHYSEALQLDMTNGVVGVVAKLGKVNDQNLSQFSSNFLTLISFLLPYTPSCDDYF